MTDFRHRLPQLGGDIFLTDAGIETTLMFLEGFDLAYFAGRPRSWMAGTDRAWPSISKPRQSLPPHQRAGRLRHRSPTH